MTHLAEFPHCDFLHVDAPDDSFDAVYAIEATCHAPDKLSIYSEVFRLLKPGACFGCYEFCLTDRFDYQNCLHLKLKADIEQGDSILELDDQQTVDNALRSVGFEVLEPRDLSIQTGPSIPWYQPLIGSGVSFASFRSTRFGGWVTHNSLKALEALHIAPQGTVRVSETLNICAAGLAEAGPARNLHADVLYPRPANRNSTMQSSLNNNSRRIGCQRGLVAGNAWLIGKTGGIPN